MSRILDIMKMKMRAGVTDAQVRAAAEKANELFTRMPGLRLRILSGPDDKGVWTDICEFDDLAAWEACKKIAHEEPGAATGYFELVDMPSMAYEKLQVSTAMVRKT